MFTVANVINCLTQNITMFIFIILFTNIILFIYNRAVALGYYLPHPGAYPLRLNFISTTL